MAKSREPKVAEVTVSPFVCKPPERRCLKILLAAVAYAVIAQIIHWIGAFLSMDFYIDPAYMGVWSQLMMPPMTYFFYYSVGFAFITGALLAAVYSMVYCCLPARTNVKRGLVYGLIVFMVAGIPGSLAMYLLINLPAMLILLWTVENLVIYLLGGAAIALVHK